MFGWFKKETTEPSGPDFSQIDSQAKVEELFRQGHLEKQFLMPREFGGQDIQLNTLYVPTGCAAAKAEIDKNVIGPLVASGTISKYSATPEYQGKSFIPIAIKIVATDPGEFIATINIWGVALTRNSK